MAKKSTRTTDRTPADQQFHAVRMSETTFRSLPADLRTPRTGRGKTKPATAAKATRAATKNTARSAAKTATKVAGKGPATKAAQPATKTLGKPAKTAKTAGKTKRAK